MIIPRRKPFFSSPNIFKILKTLLGKTGKAEVLKLENDLDKILHLPNPVVVGQGRIGLTLILNESGIKKGSEIIMPGYTFGTLTHVIKKAGFVPVPVDINVETYQMDPTKVARAVNKKTGAILATHLFGEPCDILAIKKIADKNHLYLIEDCAQALGTTKSGKLVGTFGNAAFSSFDISKPLQGIRGGVIFSKDKKLINQIKDNLKKHKKSTESPIKEAIRGLAGLIIPQTFIWYIFAYLIGFKKFQRLFVKTYRRQETSEVAYILPPIYAKIVRQNLKSFKNRLILRRSLRDMYRKILGDVVEFPKTFPDNKGSVYILPVKTNKDIFELRRYLALHGIDVALADEVADDCFHKSRSNISKVYSHTFSLPIYESLDNKKIRFISNTIQKALAYK